MDIRFIAYSKNPNNNDKRTTLVSARYCPGCPLHSTDAVVSTATHAPRIIFARAFKAYLAALTYEGGTFSAPSVAKLVEQSVEFLSTRDRIRDKFREDFADAEDFVVVYDR